MNRTNIRSRHDDGLAKIVIPDLSAKSANALSLVILKALEGTSSDDPSTFALGLSVSIQLQNLAKNV